VNRGLVLRHGKFGKSRLRETNLAGGMTIRYGSRHSTKLVRVYPKESLSCLRVELEIHPGLLRTLGISTIFQLGRLAGMLVPAHIQFVGYRWDKLERYLVRRFGESKGNRILRQARNAAETSLQSATRVLSGCGIPNPHRLQSPLRLNLRLRAAVECWAKKFRIDEELAVWSR